jgi:hypothetical protein
MSLRRLYTHMAYVPLVPLGPVGCKQSRLYLTGLGRSSQRSRAQHVATLACWQYLYQMLGQCKLHELLLQLASAFSWTTLIRLLSCNNLAQQLSSCRAVLIMLTRLGALSVRLSTHFIKAPAGSNCTGQHDDVRVLLMLELLHDLLATLLPVQSTSA